MLAIRTILAVFIQSFHFELEGPETEENKIRWKQAFILFPYTEKEGPWTPALPLKLTVLDPELKV